MREKTATPFLSVVGLLLAAAMGAAAGCAEDALDDRSLSSLNQEERRTLCEERVAELGGPEKTVQCGNGDSLGPATVANCLAAIEFDECPSTVRQWRACSVALAREGCKLFEGFPEECTALEPTCH
jgi:hypothetical protein